MLLLKRKQGAAIVIPALGITVRVVDMRDGQAILGITAPRNLVVHREEVQLRIEAETETTERETAERISA